MFPFVLFLPGGLRELDVRDLVPTFRGGCLPVFGEFAAPREPLPLFGVPWGDWAQLSHWSGRPTRTRLRRATCTLDGDDEVRVYVYVYAGRLPRAWEWT